MFEGFSREWISTEQSEIHLVTAGDGPPLLLLHGYPQSHVCWHQVAPRLAERFTVVVPDLPGYGHSQGPDPAEHPEAYSKRALAEELVEMMAALGHEEFALAGHDRGGRVAYRLALDWPEAVTRLALLDIIPTLEMLERTDRALAEATYHWFFLAQPAPLPERLIAGDPDFYLDWTLDSWLDDKQAIAPEARVAYKAAFSEDSVIAAACADYRAGLAYDQHHDREDREAGAKITAPTLVLWGQTSTDGKPLDYLQIWRSWAEEVSGQAIPSGHFLPEEAPDETTEALLNFFMLD